MTTTANDLIYELDDHPPTGPLALLAVQHVVLMSSTLVLPAVMMSEIGGGDQQASAVLALTMMACGIGTILQSVRLPGFRSGYLCPNLAGPNFFPACMSAAWLGGIPLMRGMTIFAGLTELLFARLVSKIAFLFPKQVTGLVVFFRFQQLFVRKLPVPLREFYRHQKPVTVFPCSVTFHSRRQSFH